MPTRWLSRTGRSPRGRWLPLMAAVALIVGGPGAIVAPVARAAAPTILITDTAITPADVTIVTGEVVTWRNTSSMPHAIVADDGAFDSGSLSLNDQFANLFDSTGTFRYHDPDHPELAGVVRVMQAPPTPTFDGTPPPTPPGGTLPPDFNTPVPVPTPGAGSASPAGGLEATMSPGPTASEPPAAEPGGPIGGPAATLALVLLALLVTAAATVRIRRGR